MAALPLRVQTRPFAIEPVTGIMLPDGIFDNAVFGLRIAAHFTNLASSPLTNVRIVFESVGDPGIVPAAHTHVFATIPAGASVLVTWDANFEHATPGKSLISMVARGDGFTSQRSIEQIFVSQTRYDSASNLFSCTVAEGTLTVSNITAIPPGKEWGPIDCRCPPRSGPFIPTGMTMVWTPNPAYTGVHGELPFADPWWKILAWLVALLAAIVAIVAAANSQGTANFGPFFLPPPAPTGATVTCCAPLTTSAPGQTMAVNTVAGVASAIASAAVAVGLSDAADPFWRGQEATPPASGESTIGERVVATLSLAEPPNAGRAYPVDVSFNYRRFTTGAAYSYSVTETQVNTHVAGEVEVETAPVIHLFAPLWVRARFHTGEGGLFRGTDLYAFALFQSPGGLFFVEPLSDDGLGFDPGANDGTYAGSLNLEAVYRDMLRLDPPQEIHGIWRVFLFAQDVNLTAPGTPPEIAAQEIGGSFVASAIELTFDPTLPCPLKAHASSIVI